MQVRYEDLLAEPERELRRICAFLGEPFDRAMLTYYRDESAYPTDQHNLDSLRKPVLWNNREKWRAGLTPRELRIFEAIAGAELERYGYERVVPGARISPFESLSCRYFENPPRRALAMLSNRQGHRFALETLRLNWAFRVAL
jgi:hypothetical protein